MAEMMISRRTLLSRPIFSRSVNRARNYNNADEFTIEDVQQMPLDEDECSFVGDLQRDAKSPQYEWPNETQLSDEFKSTWEEELQFDTKSSQYETQWRNETQLSIGPEIEENFENASFIRPPGFVEELDDMTSLLLTTTAAAETSNNRSTKTSDHECYAGKASRF